MFSVYITVGPPGVMTHRSNPISKPSLSIDCGIRNDKPCFSIDFQLIVGVRVDKPSLSTLTP